MVELQIQSFKYFISVPVRSRRVIKDAKKYISFTLVMAVLAKAKARPPSMGMIFLSVSAYLIMTIGTTPSTVDVLPFALALRLQAPHPVRTPKEMLETLAEQFNELTMMRDNSKSSDVEDSKQAWDVADVYGDFEKTAAESFARL